MRWKINKYLGGNSRMILSTQVPINLPASNFYLTGLLSKLHIICFLKLNQLTNTSMFIKKQSISSIAIISKAKSITSTL